MTTFTRIAAGTALATMGLTTACAAVGAGYAQSASGSLCTIEAIQEGNGTTLTGVVRADKAVSGFYQFEVKGSGKSGTSSISQGGEFEAEAGEEVEVGRVMLASPGGVFDARLEVEMNGETVTCDKRFGAI